MKKILFIFVSLMLFSGAQAEVTDNNFSDQSNVSSADNTILDGTYRMSRRCSEGAIPDDTIIEGNKNNTMVVDNNKFTLSISYLDGRTYANCIALSEGDFIYTASGEVIAKVTYRTVVEDRIGFGTKSPACAKSEMATEENEVSIVDVTDSSFKVVTGDFGEGGSCKKGDELIMTFTKK